MRSSTVIQQCGILRSDAQDWTTPFTLLQPELQESFGSSWWEVTRIPRFFACLECFSMTPTTQCKCWRKRTCRYFVFPRLHITIFPTFSWETVASVLINRGALCPHHTLDFLFLSRWKSPHIVNNSILLPRNTMVKKQRKIAVMGFRAVGKKSPCFIFCVHYDFLIRDPRKVYYKHPILWKPLCWRL